MKRYFIYSFLTLSLSSYAHIEQGLWRGVVNDSANCYMEVGAQSYENNLRHPLNERIEIKIGSTQYSVKHPAHLDFSKGEVGFNHDLFEGITPTKTGAFALQIKMIHTDHFEGPSELSIMEHNWVTGFKEVVTCRNLELVDKK